MRTTAAKKYKKQVKYMLENKTKQNLTLTLTHMNYQ